MQEWIIERLADPLWITAVGASVIIPVFGYLAKFLMRKVPAEKPIGYDIRDLPETPMLLGGRVHLTDDEREWFAMKFRHIDSRSDHFDDRLTLLNDRLSLLMSRQ